MSRTLIVGGGLAGLALALELARHGQAPLLLEAGPTFGGRAATDLTATGHRFDRGAHALFRGGALEAFLRRHRVHVPGPVASTTGSVVLLDGQIHPLPDGPASMWRSRWLDRWAFGSWLGGLALRTPSEATAADWVARLPEGPTRRLGAALTRVSVYGGSLERLDGLTAAQQVRVGLSGVRYLEGGWQSLVDALVEAARRAGATLQAGVAVTALTSDDHGVRVDTSDGPQHAEQVVLAIPPRRAHRLLDLPPPDAPAVHVAALQLALDPELVAKGPVRRLVMDLDRPVFVSDFSAVVPCGDDDSHVVHAIRYLDDDELDRQGTAVARADLHATLDRLWPGWTDAVRAQRFLPRIATTAVRPEPGGERPSEHPRPRIWCAGDGYGPHGLLADAAITSAERVGQQLSTTATHRKAS